MLPPIIGPIIPFGRLCRSVGLIRYLSNHFDVQPQDKLALTSSPGNRKLFLHREFNRLQLLWLPHGGPMSVGAKMG
jgi:hypothetical protein